MQDYRRKSNHHLYLLPFASLVVEITGAVPRRFKKAT
jgi:hypothetical protein